MMYQTLYERLTPLYPLGEAKAIVRTVLESRYGLSLTDIYTGKVSELSAEDNAELEKIIARLEKGEPVQYVLGEAMFCGRTFYVAEGVLIPRIETEVLCRWIAADFNQPYCALQPPKPLQVLDVGTGSGCIAITLQKDIDNVEVTAWDISGDALLIARRNAMAMEARVNFELEDALDPSEDKRQFDVIVSNPPYICMDEQAEMHQNVLDYEPDTALFVPNDDPLRFYTAIAKHGQKALKRGGALYFETNPRYIEQVVGMMSELGYVHIEVKEDQFGKRRFTKAIWL